MLGIFDELSGDRISIPYEEYFGEMEISNEEKEKRKELAKEFEVLLLFLFMAYAKERSSEVKKILQDKYKDIATAFIGAEKASSYIEEYAKQIIEDTIRVTNENINDPYYTSWDRAMFIAENEANSIGNYRQQLEAVKSGKKYKTWLTMNDKKVRHTHKEIDSLKIPIFETFQVGDSKMMFPKDSNGEAKEIIGCRCVLEYS